jgi:hypothetical protein
MEMAGMFRRSSRHEQRDLFDDILTALPESKRAKALSSREYAFYKEVFCRIDEGIFEPLFAGRRGRPNAPLNRVAGAMVLREMNHWTYDELFRNLDFNLLTRLSLGLTDLSTAPFCPATLFNFQERLVQYERENGINLFEQLFRAITGEQLARLGIDTSIQRCDSFRAMSNIANYGRVRLLIEILLRLHRVLEPEDRRRFAAVLAPYTSQSSENYVYGLDDSELPRELQQLALIYAQLHAELGSRYANDPAYGIFTRALQEQFELSDNGEVRVRERKELGSGTLQSPDDPEATYNAKNGKPQKGYKVNVVETAAPENPVNLITDITVAPNNVHDGTMLAATMDQITKQTPDLAEMHTDGGYGGSALDPKMAEHGVLHVETGTRMGHARVNMRYEAAGDGGYTVSCPYQTAVAESTPTRWKAIFDDAVCRTCPHVGQCPTVQHPGKRTLYFEESWAKSSIRSRNIELVPEERRQLRANVEATVKQFTGCFNHKGKLRVRGLASTVLQMLAASLAINFARIFRHQAADSSGSPVPTAIAGLLSRLINAVRLCIRRLHGQLHLARFLPLLWANSPTRTPIHCLPPCLNVVLIQKAFI